MRPKAGVGGTTPVSPVRFPGISSTTGAESSRRVFGGRSARESPRPLASGSARVSSCVDPSAFEPPAFWSPTTRREPASAAAGWQAGQLPGMMTGRPARWPTGWLTGRQAGWLAWRPACLGGHDGPRGWLPGGVVGWPCCLCLAGLLLGAADLPGGLVGVAAVQEVVVYHHATHDPHGDVVCLQLGCEVREWAGGRAPDSRRRRSSGGSKSIDIKISSNGRQWRWSWRRRRWWWWWWVVAAAAVKGRNRAKYSSIGHGIGRAAKQVGAVRMEVGVVVTIVAHNCSRNDGRQSRGRCRGSGTSRCLGRNGSGGALEWRNALEWE